jgi:hypothetical protein
MGPPSYMRPVVDRNVVNAAHDYIVHRELVFVKTDNPKRLSSCAKVIRSLCCCLTFSPLPSYPPPPAQFYKLIPEMEYGLTSKLSVFMFM